MVIEDADGGAGLLLLNDCSNSFFTSTGVSALAGTTDDCEDCCIALGEGVGVGVRAMVVSPTCCTGLGANRFCSSELTFFAVTVTLTPGCCNTGVTFEVACDVTGSRLMMVTFVSPMLDAELTDTTGAFTCN